MIASATQIDRQPSASLAKSIDHKTASSWVRGIIDAYEAFPVSWSEASHERYDKQEEAAVGLLGVIQPVLIHAKNQFNEELTACANVGLCLDQKTFIDAYFAYLPNQVLPIIGRTLVLELYIAKLEGRLQGQSPEDRYRYFIDAQRRRDVALARLAEYPGLALQVTTRADQWRAFGREFVRHLIADWPRLRETFFLQSSDRVERVEPRGDQHRRGRSVLVVQFASGKKLVYKPKSLAVDRHFQQLAEFLNRHGLDPPLRLLKVLDTGNHGWAEFVEPGTCSSNSQVERFYRRQGTMVALSYLLGATDFHFENVLPVGEHPMLIDLEVFFHPETESVDGESAEQTAQRMLDDTVLRTGLLPQPVWGNQEREGIDLSGIAAAADQPLPFAAPAWEAAGTDEMRFARKAAWFSGGKNRVTLHGKPVDAYRYLAHIEQGFEAAWQLICRLRLALLAEDGPIRQFARDDVRVLVRSTQVYERLRSESFHPDLFRDFEERELLLRQLWRICERQPAMLRIVQHELEDLRAGDIPLFTTRPDSLDLWTSSGVKIENYFQRSGLECAVDRFGNMDERNLRWQRGLIRTSILSLEPKEEASVHSARVWDIDSAQVPVPNLNAQLIDAAAEIGDRLISLAIEGRRDVTWVSHYASNDGRATPGVLGLNLYDGLPGIALFLGYLGATCNNQRYTDYADRALRAMRGEGRKNDPALSTPGAFSGWGGVVYCLTQLGSLWRREPLLDEARQLIARLRFTIDSDDQMDIMGGAAGCLGTVMSFYDYRPSDELLQVALQCGDRLGWGACELSQGVGWPLPSTSGALTGFSHGAAGIAWALLILADASGQPQFGDLAQKALRFERASFCTRHRNWFDFRLSSSGDEASPCCATAWCHGAPGIGLGRLASLPYLEDDHYVRDEISTAVATTIESGFGFNHSLCHGDLGNIELLGAAARLGDPTAASQLGSCTTAILRDIQSHGWRCGTPGMMETPGLMTGLAGIGYGLLRLALPNQVPSVLTLEGPRV